MVDMTAFVAAALVILLIPGPGVIYIVTRSLGQGRRAGLVSVLGLSAGALVHVAAAAVGLSAILMTSAAAFTVVKLAGAGYLIYLGIRTLVSRAPGTATPHASPRPLRRLFTEGVLISVLNPKIAVFFLAFLPQFVSPGQGAVTQQIVTLGLLYVGLALITDSGYALLAGSLRQLVSDRVTQGPLPRYATGAVYIGLGVTTALGGRRQ
ncbi:MAG: LysE family translocator [Acidobacteriota bacterium]|nr:LysE family translocator [Acidobacteriota bacterium]